MPGSPNGFTLADAAEIASIVGAVGIVGVIGIIYNAAASGLKATFFSRLDESRKLNQLACGVTVDYVDSLLGPPQFRLTAGPDKIANSPGVTLLSRRIYRLRQAWLEVIVGFDGSVRAFSITVTNPRFKFRTGHLTFGALDVHLGATRFAAVADPPDGWLSRTGARTFAYAESHYFGNPAGYQTYVLAYNSLGPGHYEVPPPVTVGQLPGPPPLSGGRLSPETDSHPAREPLPEWLRPARDKTTVNTLTVLMPVGDVAPIQGWPGVDGDRVRLLRQAFTKREIRRRRRAAMTEARRAVIREPDIPDAPKTASFEPTSD